MYTLFYQWISQDMMGIHMETACLLTQCHVDEWWSCSFLFPMVVIVIVKLMVRVFALMEITILVLVGWLRVSCSFLLLFSAI